jgi:hypothetical protein
MEWHAIVINQLSPKNSIMYQFASLDAWDVGVISLMHDILSSILKILN